MAVQITWLGHSGFELALESGEVALIDPWIDGNPSFPKGRKIERADLILATHGHSDHFANVVSLAKQLGSTVAATFEICQYLSGKGVSKVAPMNKGGSQTLLGCKVTMTHAQHSSSIDDGGKLIYAGEPGGFVVTLPDGRALYHAGDTNVFSDMQLIRRLYKPSLAMLPIGDLFTMDPREAALACEFLKPEMVIPMHYGTFPLLTGTPEGLRKALADQPGVTVVAPEPGETISW
jgi:L-ascorbate metabolism protein UlaG (beta-lactamase superfamily)